MMPFRVIKILSAVTLIFLRLPAVVLGGSNTATANNDKENEDEYDYIVVGGGTAGCVIAARICAAIPDATVALLERGSPRNDDEDFIQQSLHRVFDTWESNLSERWQSEPNLDLFEANDFPYAPILNDDGSLQFGRTVDILTGATLGGTSSTNANQWTVAKADDIEGWGIANLDGAMAAKYYARAADVVQPIVPPPAFSQNYTQDWLDAASRAGYERLADRETRTSTAHEAGTVFEPPVGLDPTTGRRRDSCTAYLTPAMAGPCSENLFLIQSATVTKLVVDEGGTTVNSIQYVNTSESSDSLNATTLHSVSPRVQLILCAGPYGSPKLLQLSGIGPASVLKDAGVDQVADLPVGSSTQGRAVSFIISTYTKEIDWSNDFLQASLEAREQFERGEGGVEAVICPASVGGALEGAYLEGSFCHPTAGQGIKLIISVCVMNPTSRGSLKVSSTDPFAPPKVFLNLVGAEEERVATANCLAEIRGINGAFTEDFGVTEFIPGATTPEEDYVGSARNGYHFVGGCSVGSVVDENLSLLGFDNVRIVDASVIPDIPRSAGPLASVYMLAEYLADQLIDENPFGMTSVSPSVSPIDADLASSSDDGGTKIGKGGKKGSKSSSGSTSKNGMGMSMGRRRLKRP